VVGTCLHALNNYIFVFVFDLGVIGTGISEVITYAFLLSTTVFLTRNLEELRGTSDVTPFSQPVLKGLGQYFSIGYPTMVLMFLDWSTFEFMTLMSGLLSVVEQASQILLLNICSQLFQIPYGIQQATCQIIGCEIGRQDKQ